MEEGNVSKTYLGSVSTPPRETAKEVQVLARTCSGGIDAVIIPLQSRGLTVEDLSSPYSVQRQR